MIYDRERIYEIGKNFDSGSISFDSLTDSEKYALSRYYALKNEELDGKIWSTTANLSSINAHLDNVYNNLKGI